MDTVYLHCHIADNGFLLVSKIPAKVCVCDPSPGIEIYAYKAPVYSVSEGKVQRVFSIGDSTVMMIRNGDMYYIYGDLTQANIKEGDTIHTNDCVGDMEKESSGLYRLNFQVWKQKHRKRGEPVTDEEMMAVLQGIKK